MFTIRAINYQMNEPVGISVDDREIGAAQHPQIRRETVNAADYYEVRKSVGCNSITGYANDGAVTCRHEIYSHDSKMGSSCEVDAIFVTNDSGKTIDRVHSPGEIEPRNAAA